MPFKPGNPHRFKPGQVTNPGGRPSKSVAGELQKLAVQTGAHEVVAEMILTGILAGRVPLDLIRDHVRTLDSIPIALARMSKRATEGDALELDMANWQTLVRTWMPPPVASAEDDGRDSLEEFFAAIAPKVAEFAKRRAASGGDE